MSQMVTYKLSSTQSVLWSVTSRKGHLDDDLQPVQNPEYAFFSYEQRRASQMVTYKQFNTQTMLLSVTSREGQPDVYLPSVHNPEHALVSKKKER